MDKYLLYWGKPRRSNLTKGSGNGKRRVPIIARENVFMREPVYQSASSPWAYKLPSYCKILLFSVVGAWIQVYILRLCFRKSLSFENTKSFEWSKCWWNVLNQTLYCYCEQVCRLSLSIVSTYYVNEQRDDTFLRLVASSRRTIPSALLRGMYV